MEINQNLKSYLIEKHLADLKDSGLTPEQIRVARHFSADKAKSKKLTGYEIAGLIFSYCDLDGQPYLRTDGKPFYRIKPDWGNRKTEDSPKYLSPKKEGCRPYFSCLCLDWSKVAKSTKINIWETEGEKKGDCGCANGLAVIAFGGVDGWVDRCDRETGKALEKSRVLPELESINWKDRKVLQCFDSDVIEKLPVQLALAKRARELKQSGALPYLVLLPNELDGSKNGLDDFVVRHGSKALNELSRIAQPTSLKVSRSGRGDRESEGEEKVTLDLKEPDEYCKAVMAWSVLKELWVYRAGVGWYEWQKICWKLKTQEEFETSLNQFMDAQNWRKRTSSIMTSIIRLLRSRLLIENDGWNLPEKLAFRNGTLDVSSGRFTENHNPDDHLTQYRPYNFDPTAECPTWLRFINEAMEGDKERIQLIQAVFRYAVLPKSRNRKAEIEKSFDFFGQKGTGKGTALDVLTNLVGIENVGPASTDTFKNATGLGQLIDKDIAIDHDASGFLSNIGIYNKVVSNELVEVKKLYQNAYTTRLGVVVVRAYNAFISVPDGSEGLDRRLTVIPFNHQPKVIDTELSRKLEAELPGIFTWCYSLSAHEMKQQILSAGRLRVVAEASIERFEANNPEFRFLSEVFPEGKEGVKAGTLYQSYQEWCKENGHQLKSRVKFAPAIRALGCTRSPGKSNGCFFYTIPKMADFDVVSHLGIVQGGIRDSCKDSSNPLPNRDRDSCRQLNPEISLCFDQGINKGLEGTASLTQKSLDLQLSTTIPNTHIARVSSISEVSQSVSITPTFQIGDPIEALVEGTWRLGVLINTPNNHPDPRQRFSGWQVRLSGEERKSYIWNAGDLRNPSQVEVVRSPNANLLSVSTLF